MQTTRRKLLLGLATLPFSTAAALAQSPPEPKEPHLRLVGTWQSTIGETSVILSIQPPGEALVILGEKGAFGMARTHWRPLPGGLFVDGFPRFRLWLGNNDGELRAEMDLPDGPNVSAGLRRFPRSFFMRRVPFTRFPRELLARPLPDRWQQDAVDADWDEKAGKPKAEPPPPSHSVPPTNSTPRVR
jgi:hypothetical protein